MIAVLCNTSPAAVDMSDVEDVLYGSLLGQHRADAQPPEPSKIHEPGLWLSQGGKWKRPDLPQVITAMNVPTLRIPRCQPLLWTTRDVKAAHLRQPSWLAPVHMTTNGPRVGSATSTAQLLGIPEAWPIEATS